MDPALLERAARLLREGGLVAFPTETVYGLGANALDAAAVRRIFAVKGRPATSPLIVHTASIGAARAIAAQWPEQAELLARRYWPGPLTLVVARQPQVPGEVTAGLGTVGLRVPAHPLAMALIEAAGVPVAAPSANRFTSLSPTTAQHVHASLGEAVDLVLDGGPTPVGIESTVLSLAGERPVLLRPGMIGREELERHLGPLEVARQATGAHPAPGLHPRHYSPRTPLVLVSGGPPPRAGRGLYLSHLPGAQAPLPAKPWDYAAALYATLHEADLAGYDWIAVEWPPETAEWEAIRDRLERAAGTP
jgi:L-threonylcarbamoyladenylate synthase